MTRIEWKPSDAFEFGIDQVVVYPETHSASPWSGILDINLKNDEGTNTSFYKDGKQYGFLISNVETKLEIKSISYPISLFSSLGFKSIIPGIFLTKQQKQRFNISYKTIIGENKGYKIHLMYNCFIKASNIIHKTKDNSSNIQTYTWTIESLPLTISGLKPTSYFVFDTTKMSEDLVQFLEDIIYGSENYEPRLPTESELFNMIHLNQPFGIQYYTDGLYLLINLFDDLRSTDVNGIRSLSPNTRLKTTQNPGIYRLES